MSPNYGKISSGFDVDATFQNTTLEFVWWYIYDANSDTQWYYSVNNGATNYVSFATDQVNLDIPVSEITSLKVGVKSSKFFADYDEEPEDEEETEIVINSERKIDKHATKKNINI